MNRPSGLSEYYLFTVGIKALGVKDRTDRVGGVRHVESRHGQVLMLSIVFAALSGDSKVDLDTRVLLHTPTEDTLNSRAFGYLHLFTAPHRSF